MTQPRLARQHRRAQKSDQNSQPATFKEPPLTLAEVYKVEQMVRDEEPQRRIGLLFLTKTLAELQRIAAQHAKTLEDTLEITLSAAERVEGLLEALHVSLARQHAALAFSKEAKEQAS